MSQSPGRWIIVGRKRQFVDSSHIRGSPDETLIVEVSEDPTKEQDRIEGPNPPAKYTEEQQTHTMANDIPRHNIGASSKASDTSEIWYEKKTYLLDRRCKAADLGRV